MVKLSSLNKNIYRLGEIAAMLGVSIHTLHNHEDKGILVCDRTAGGQRRVAKKYLINYLNIIGLLEDDSKEYSVIYANVDSIDKADILDKQVLGVLSKYGTFNNLKVVKDIGEICTCSGYLGLIDDMLNGSVNNIYICNYDRFCCDKSFQIFMKIAKSKNVEVLRG